MADNGVLITNNAVKHFGKKEILKEVNFCVPKGCVMGLLGKNGAGKTTLLKCALGMMRLQSGNITIFNEDSWSLSAKAKERLGYVPQILESSFYPWMRITQVIDYIGSFYPTWNVDYVQQLRRDLELEHNDRVIKLSGGEKQKLAIILALGHQPEFLILDEPAASLDPISRRNFLNTLVKIVASQECTILLSTHLISDLEQVANRLAILANGYISYQGEMKDLKSNIKCLQIMFTKSIPKDLTIPGTIRCEMSEKKAKFIVKNFSPQLIDSIKAKFNAVVTVQDLSLEDIFIELYNK